VTDAAAAYMQKVARARTMLKTLAMLLDAHSVEHVKEPDRWDLVGDLGALNEKLGEAAAGMERDCRGKYLRDPLVSS